MLFLYLFFLVLGYIPFLYFYVVKIKDLVLWEIIFLWVLEFISEKKKKIILLFVVILLKFDFLKKYFILNKPVTVRRFLLNFRYFIFFSWFYKYWSIEFYVFFLRNKRGLYFYFKDIINFFFFYRNLVLWGDYVKFLSRFDVDFHLFGKRKRKVSYFKFVEIIIFLFFNSIKNILGFNAVLMLKQLFVEDDFNFKVKSVFLNSFGVVSYCYGYFFFFFRTFKIFFSYIKVFLGYIFFFRFFFNNRSLLLLYKNLWVFFFLFFKIQAKLKFNLIVLIVRSIIFYFFVFKKEILFFILFVCFFFVICNQFESVYIYIFSFIIVYIEKGIELFLFFGFDLKYLLLCMYDSVMVYSKSIYSYNSDFLLGVVDRKYLDSFFRDFEQYEEICRYYVAKKQKTF